MINILVDETGHLGSEIYVWPAQLYKFNDLCRSDASKFKENSFFQIPDTSTRAGFIAITDSFSNSKTRASEMVKRKPFGSLFLF